MSQGDTRIRRRVYISGRLSKSNVFGTLVTVLGSLITGTLAQLASVPAAWLVGPMFFAVFIALTMPQKRPEVPLWIRWAAQAIVGCVLATNFVPSILPMVAREWPAVALAVSGTLILSLLTAFLLSRLLYMDEKTAGLGVLPGAAAGMLAMGQSLGADVRLVALMQYGRMILVVASAALVASLWVPLDPSVAPESTGIPGETAANLLVQGTGYIYALTGLIAVIGMLLGVRLGLPAGALLGPLLLSISLEEAGVLHVAVPGFVSPIAYALIGIYAGLLFDRASLRQAWRLLPFMFASTLALMVACAGLGWIFARLTGADYLTAYLATTPGGIDSVAIMAVGSDADASLVLAVQMLRLFSVVIIGAILGRKWSTNGQPA